MFQTIFSYMPRSIRPESSYYNQLDDEILLYLDDEATELVSEAEELYEDIDLKISIKQVAKEVYNQIFEDLTGQKVDGIPIMSRKTAAIISSMVVSLHLAEKFVRNLDDKRKELNKAVAEKISNYSSNLSEALFGDKDAIRNLPSKTLNNLKIKKDNVKEKLDNYFEKQEKMIKSLQSNFEQRKKILDKKLNKLMEKASIGVDDLKDIIKESFNNLMLNSSIITKSFNHAVKEMFNDIATKIKKFHNQIKENINQKGEAIKTFFARDEKAQEVNKQIEQSIKKIEAANPNLKNSLENLQLLVEQLSTMITLISKQLEQVESVKKGGFVERVHNVRGKGPEKDEKGPEITGKS